MAYEMRIRYWLSFLCSSDLLRENRDRIAAIEHITHPRLRKARLLRRCAALPRDAAAEIAHQPPAEALVEVLGFRQVPRQRGGGAQVIPQRAEHDGLDDRIDQGQEIGRAHV